MSKKRNIRRPRIELSEKQIKRLKEDVTRDAVQKTSLLSIAVMADSLNMNEDQICDIATKISRWATYLDDHVIRINEVADIIERKTGIKFSRF